ncbi:hypothetical protein H632_c608p0 [Helicosporidium sp. ATCC 50920]|nr:hypothetical protein H632_c608p0 [Helicosporidium sp. ATCC 50920]|eukprot:KDD75580.1 hypothetical protein H632_c608p0 [Helicosporidium sp. ATCC 50920]
MVEETFELEEGDMFADAEGSRVDSGLRALSQAPPVVRETEAVSDSLGVSRQASGLTDSDDGIVLDDVAGA